MPLVLVVTLEPLMKMPDMNRPIFVSLLFLAGSSLLSAQSESPTDTILVQWVREITSTPMSGVDVPNDVVVDGQGNLFVTGKSEGQGTGYDYLTVKYNSTGVALWTARYDGPYHGFDIPNAIAVDAAGNVYVTGMSIGSDSTFNDFATIKYSYSGVTQWVARYNGPRNETDAASDIAVDQSGNVFVTGFQSGPYAHDYATIKYSPEGYEQWVATYDDGPAHFEEAIALGLDDDGNVYVTGTIGSNDSFDWATIKYDGAGNQLWIATYDVTDPSMETPAAIAVDGDGTIIIVGSVTYEGGGGGSGIATVKYSSDGSIIWAETFPGVPPSGESNTIALAKGISLDENGNVYVTGTIGAYPSYYLAGDSLVTIKYSATGVLQWAAYHDDRTSGAVTSGGIAVDQNENVLVTGTHGYLADPLYSYASAFRGDSIATLCYNTDGLLQWARYYEGSDGPLNISKGIGVDELGNAYVIGASGLLEESDFVSLKYSPAGTEIWTSSSNGPGNSIAFVSAATIDLQGNVYVTGGSYGQGMKRDYKTVKVDPQGTLVWSATYDGPAHDMDHPTDIAVDDSGNVYVTGSSYSSPSNQDYATVKYSPSGIQLWEARYENSAGTVPLSLSVDRSHNVYVGGFPGIVKYDATGAQQWNVSIGGMPITTIAVDDSGYVYGSGKYYDYSCTPLIKVSSTGIVQWTAQACGSMLVLDSVGNIYLTGSNGTIMVSANGDSVWGVGQGGTRIHLSNQAYVYVGEGGGYLHKLTTGGTHLWTQGFHGGWSNISDFAVDGFGNAYLSGSDWSPSWTLELLTTKYTLSGEERWSARYGGGAFSEYRGVDILSDPLGNIYVIGEKAGTDFTTTPVIVKYSPFGTVSSSQESEVEVPLEYSLEQNYPNPFNPSTTIAFQIPSPDFVELTVYNILGREVATLVNERLPAGKHTVKFDGNRLASGIYFYQLNAGAYVATKKLLLLK